MLTTVSSQFSSYQTEFPNALEEVIQGLVQAKDDRQLWEKKLQLLLNQGMKLTEEEFTLLRSSGYSISHDPQTLDKFRTFTFPTDSELTTAIQSAHSEGGLLIDKYKMYRPGPASAKHCDGAAKGYNEIFALFEQQTTEKKAIALDTYNFIASFEENLPEEHLWKRKKVLVDMACGNGVQTQELSILYPCSVIGIDNQQGCIDQCQKLMSDQTFMVHDCFKEVPLQFKEKADLLFVSHFYCPTDKATLLIERLKEFQKSENVLVVFVNGCNGADADRIANKLPFLRGKPSASMSNDFEKALDAHGYSSIEKVSQAKLLFPELTPMIRQQLLQIQRGDYENPYTHINSDFKTFKALMEFIASYPLESMAEEEIALYLHELEDTFKVNGGPHLKIYNKMIFAHPNNAEEAFKLAFQQAGKDNKEDPVFEQICNKMELGLFAEAKKELGKLLESIDIENKDVEKSIAGFQLMSEIHLKEGKYPEAAGILWYAKRLDKEGKSHKKIDVQLDAIERSLLHKATNANGPIRGIVQSKLDQEKLDQLRRQIREEYNAIKLIEDNSERAQALRSLYQHKITQGLKAYIHELAQDVISQMADWGLKNPCDYALIGLGSLAREEMTPYSDFEFAILIDSENEKDKEFFRLFTNLLHLRFINLGETILPSLNIPCLDWIFDTITPRGLSFDGSMLTACKTPLGKKRNQEGDYELIHSPHEMSQLQFINAKDEEDRLWILKRYHLPSILSACTYVSGSKQGVDLVSEYQKKVQIILEKGEGKQRAFDLIKDDLDHFKPCLEEEESGKHYNVKKDLYRLPNTMFDGLANYFCLESTSTWERIEELRKKGILTSRAAQDLKELIMLSQELRLSTYLKHSCQKDHLDIDTQKSKLQELYCKVLPFAVAMEVFCSEIKNGSPEMCLKKDCFYENSSFHEGIIAFRHMDYLEAHRCLNLEVLDTLDYYEVLGSVERTLGKYKEAEKTYLKAINKKPSCELYMKLGSVRQALAHYKKDKYGDESAEEAFLKAKELAQDDELLLERVHRALTSFYKDFGDYNSVREHLSICKEISKKRTSIKKKDSEYGVILDLDFAWTQALEGHISSNIDSKFKKSGQLFHSAKRIFKGYYRRKDHRAVAKSYNDVGFIFGKLGKYKEALKQQQKASNIVNTIFEENHPDVAVSHHHMGAILGKLGRHKEALEHEQKALEVLIAIFGENHPNVSTAFNSIGNTLVDLGRHKEALEQQQKALEIRLAVFGEEHPAIANVYSNMGTTLVMLGKYDEALHYQQKALKILTAIFGEEHADVASLYNNQGTILQKLGKLEEAKELQQKALKLQRTIFGEEHPALVASYSNLGSVFRELGKYKEALEYQQKALDMKIAIFEENHPSVANAYNNIGAIFEDLGEYEKALKYNQEALKIVKIIFENNHPSVATSYDNVGSLFGSVGKHKEALKYQQKALEIRLANFGENHPDVAISYDNVGNALLKLDRHEEALKQKQKALEIRLTIFEEEHSDVAISYTNIGSMYKELGKHQEALEQQEKALKIQRKLFGEMHPVVAISYNNMGAMFAELGKHEKALELHQKALEIRLAAFGEKHPTVATSYNNLGEIYGELGKHEDALKHKQKALEIRLAIFGEEHADVAISYNNLRATLIELKEYEKALEQQQKALDIQLKIFGETHSLVATSYNNKGGVLGNLGRHMEALELHQKALKMQIAIFGEKHSDVAFSYNNVGDMFRVLGQHDEALENLQKALSILIGVFGEIHPLVAISYNNVGAMFEELGNYEEGLKHQKKALNIQRKMHGEMHPDVARAYADLGHMSFQSKDYFSAISYLKSALDIYQSHPGYQLNSKMVDIYEGLNRSYFLQNNKEKHTEYLKESKKISKEIDNQKAFQKNQVLLQDLLLNKKYQEAYKLLRKLPKYLKDATDFLCLHLQTAILCPGLNKKTLEKYIHIAESALNNDEGSIPTQMKLCMNLAAYWLKSNKWEKVNDCISHLQKLLNKAPTFCYQYTLLDLLPFEGNPLIEGECIPVEILRNFLLLKMYQGKKNHQILFAL